MRSHGAPGKGLSRRPRCFTPPPAPSPPRPRSPDFKDPLMYDTRLTSHGEKQARASAPAARPPRSTEAASRLRPAQNLTSPPARRRRPCARACAGSTRSRTSSSRRPSLARSAPRTSRWTGWKTWTVRQQQRRRQRRRLPLWMYPQRIACPQPAHGRGSPPRIAPSRHPEGHPPSRARTVRALPPPPLP